jgi:carbon-monoxide dehydrogenase small subunit
MSDSNQAIPIQLTVNDQVRRANVDPRTLLVHLVREQFGLTGANIGCLNGYCGACTTLVDGQAVKSCTVLACSVDGCAITTVEGLAQNGELQAIQQAFWDEYGFQCGYCTPGMILTVTELLAENSDPSDADVRRAISGNLCRCTGYQNIIKAVQAAAAALRGKTSM